MSIDKLVDSTQLDNDLTSIANAIRSRSGTTSLLLFPTDFISQIQVIPSIRMIDYYKITFDTTATQNNPKSLYTSPNLTKYCIFFCIDTNPPAPNPNEYIALTAMRTYITQGYSNTGFILRPAGTIGTDGSMINYIPSTGEIKIGGAYGHFMAGTTYHLYVFQIA